MSPLLEVAIAFSMIICEKCDYWTKSRESTRVAADSHLVFHLTQIVGKIVCTKSFLGGKLFA